MNPVTTRQGWPSLHPVYYILEGKFMTLLKKLSSLRIQALILFLLLALLPALFIGSLSIQKLFSSNMTNALTYNQSTLKIIAEEVDALMKRSIDIGKMVESESIIQKNLRQSLPENVSTRYLEELEVSETLNFIHNYTMKDIFGIYVLGLNGGKYRSNSLSFFKESYITEVFFQNALHADAPLWSHTEDHSIAVTVIDGNFISVAQKITDKYSGRPLGVVVVEIKLDYIQSFMDSAEIIELGSLIFKDNQQILYATDLVQDTLPHGSSPDGENVSTVYFQNRNGAQSVFNSAPTIAGWQICSVVPLSNIQSQGFHLVRAVIIASLLTLLAAVFSAFFASRFLTRPIKMLSEKMLEVEQGDLDVSLHTRTSNEIGQLIKSFNSMLEKIRALMDKIYQDQKKLRKYQFSLLQSQIQPHFLYNTLDSIIWLIRDNRNEDAIKLDVALIKLLRISLHDGQDVLTIQKEREHIENYLSILKIRYEDKLDYRIDIPEKFFDYLIPKFTLQPFVENAIYHGIKNKPGKGLLTIDCHEAGKNLHFMISDNGAGMDLLTLEKVNGMDYFVEDGGIGIKNVAERLFLHFQSASKVWLESSEEEGTITHIIIPKTTEEPHDENRDR